MSEPRWSPELGGWTRNTPEEIAEWTRQVTAAGKRILETPMCGTVKDAPLTDAKILEMLGRLGALRDAISAGPTRTINLTAAAEALEWSREMLGTLHAEVRRRRALRRKAR